MVWCLTIFFAPYLAIDYPLPAADILLGRGNRVLNHPGNASFRRLVVSRKDDYTGADGNASKNEVARQVFECIRTGTGIPSAEGEAVPAIPGRFMKKEGGEESDLWDEVTDEVALEKCKMALRQIDRRDQKKAARAAARAVGAPARVEASRADGRRGRREGQLAPRRRQLGGGDGTSTPYSPPYNYLELKFASVM